MPQWEHMAVHADDDEDTAGARLTVIAPSGVPEIVDHDATISRVVQLLNDLGDAGWQVAAVDRNHYMQGDDRVFWLRRERREQ